MRIPGVRQIDSRLWQNEKSCPANFQIKVSSQPQGSLIEGDPKSPTSPQIYVLNSPLFYSPKDLWALSGFQCPGKALYLDFSTGRLNCADTEYLRQYHRFPVTEANGGPVVAVSTIACFINFLA